MRTAASAIARAVFDPSRGPIEFIARTTIAALVATSALLFITDWFGFLTDSPDPTESLTWLVVQTMVLAPIMENAVLVGLIELLTTFALRHYAITAIITVLSGLAHWFAGEWRAYAGAVLFAVMTHSYFVWRNRTVGWRYRLIVMQHVLFNAPAIVEWAWTQS